MLRPLGLLWACYGLSIGGPGWSLAFPEGGGLDWVSILVLHFIRTKS